MNKKDIKYIKVLLVALSIAVFFIFQISFTLLWLLEYDLIAGLIGLIWLGAMFFAACIFDKLEKGLK